jgi:DNA-directed RNA polymerase subunit RPC12/RpoP
MRVLCGQCGQLNELEDDYAEATVTCARCGHVVPVPRMANGQAGEPGEAPADRPAEAAGQTEEPGFAEQARQSPARKIPVTCPHCGKTVHVSARVAGRKGRCKECDHPLDIPYPDDLEEFELPALYKGDAEHETGLDLVPPPEAAEPAVERSQREVEPAIDLAPQPDLSPGPVEHDLAELAALHPAADLAALDRELSRVQPVRSEGTGQLASAVQDFHEEKHAARPREAKGPRRLRWLLLLLAAAAVVVLPLSVVVPLLTRDDPNSDLAGRPPGGEPNTAPVRPIVTPATTQAATRSQPAPKPRTPTCEVLAAASAPFLADGYFPAPARSLYWRIAARISAGKEPISFQTFGNDVRLVFGNERFASLGEPAGNSGIFPARSRRSTVSLQAHEARKVTFLFEVPVELFRGRFFIRGVTYEDIALPVPREPLAVSGLAGTYKEAAPRNLKPMLRDPVMAAIQATPRQRLVVSPEAEGIRVTLPAARVTGAGKQVAPGLFRMPLKHRQHSLDASVRFVEGGRRAILYLADRPFHQLTYVNAKARAPRPRPKPKPKPAPVAKVDPRAKKPTPRPVVGPGVGSRWDDSHGYDPNARRDPNEKIVLPTGPSIFD